MGGAQNNEPVQIRKRGIGIKVCMYTYGEETPPIDRKEEGDQEQEHRDREKERKDRRVSATPAYSG